MIRLRAVFLIFVTVSGIIELRSFNEETNHEVDHIDDLVLDIICDTASARIGEFTSGLEDDESGRGGMCWFDSCPLVRCAVVLYDI